ncbi:uncharacterized protein EAF01_003063 [Botrytis porri]|uniref:Methyltransferase domain-containing protein n=1 Tax=Botrytis porri TaxID=87229 RepID=A0A4Z1KQ27_9HELO|nr:uncharacterized protein EAF01_003063 [Botrytis porri]KAF7909345.1 hypothetical protein EAF01_003063 [Botrytis porri]TGO87688.1 hypothetical protein BPOR_0210g00170 [Botrytis porri]
MAETIIPREILDTYFPKTSDLPPEHDEERNETLLAQIRHRVELVNFWSIPPGSKVLEIGCGQGDTTLVLAAQVGENGHVDAVDPGDPDYGSPWTLSQAQSQLRSGPLGHRITFHNTFSIPFLESLLSSLSSSSPTTQDSKPYTHIILSHSTFYFSSPSLFPQLISYISSLLLSSPQSSNSIPTPNLLTNQTQICIAEWNLNAPTSTQFPHLLAIMLQAISEGFKKEGEEGGGNVRCVRSATQMRKVMRERGWKIEREMVKDGRGLEDGVWEVGNVGRWKEGELRRVREAAGEDKEGKRGNVLEMMYDVLEKSLRNVEGGLKGVEAMGVWVARFVREDL